MHPDICAPTVALYNCTTTFAPIHMRANNCVPTFALYNCATTFAPRHLCPDICALTSALYNCATTFGPDICAPEGLDSLAEQKFIVILLLEFYYEILCALLAGIFWFFLKNFTQNFELILSVIEQSLTVILVPRVLFIEKKY
jgi:hypothetical protein